MANTQTSDGSILIAHIADTHLRDSQYVTTRRGDDFFAATLQAIEHGIQHADILVIVGDIFDKSRPSPKVIGQLMQIDRRLRDAGKAALAVTGNHDWSDPTWLNTLFPSGVPAPDAEIDGASGIIPLDGTSARFRGFRFVGIRPYSVSGFRERLAEVTVQARGADVVLYHGFVDGVVPFYAGQDPLRVDELPVAKENKAWLLGDIHVQGYVTRDRPGGGQVQIGYPGSTEMCTASEPTEKSVPVIKLTQDEAAIHSRWTLRTRPFITADVVSEADLDALMLRVSAHATEDPVVVVHFDRGLPQTINRLHSTLDAQRSVIRCYPLPTLKTVTARAVDRDLEAPLSMDHFVTTRLGSRPGLHDVAIDLLHRGDVDAHGILSQFVENRLASLDVREEA